MAKQNNDLPKATRVIYVFEAIQKIKEASPEQILNAVANRMAVKPDAKLKRLIYRDLKDLRYRNQIDFDSYHADGIRVDIDDQKKYKNIRHVYFITSGTENVKVTGIGYLDSVQCGFYPSKNGLMNWTITPSSQFNFTKKMVFVLAHKNGHSVSLSISQDELPAKILILRTIKNIEILQKRLIKEFGNRTAVLVIKDDSISTEKSDRLGHALIEITSMQKILVHDLKSTNGTSIANCDLLSIKDIKNTDRTTRTVLKNPKKSYVSQLYETSNFSDFVEIDKIGKTQAPFIIKIGFSYIYVGYV